MTPRTRCLDIAATTLLVASAATCGQALVSPSFVSISPILHSHSVLPVPSSRIVHPKAFRLFMSDEYDEEEEENPCWQDFYDDDCAMASAEAATFVASKWIRSMPCAEGIEDCDMPEELQAPGTRKEAGIDHVDVMGFLGLKRAERVGKVADGLGMDDGTGEEIAPKP